MPGTEATRRSKCATALFGIDLRVLALYRMAAGGMLLVDLLVRWPDALFWLGPSSFYPPELARGSLPLCLSLHALSDATWLQVSLFALAALLAISLVLGYRSRWSAGLSWYLLISLHLRNLNMVDVGDSLFGLSLLWLMFLPCGSAWSLDARRTSRGEANTVVSFASAGLLLQPALAFFCAGIAKLHGTTWREGTAVGLAVSDDDWSTPLGLWLAESPTLVALATHSTFLVELGAPVLLFLPWWRDRLRPAVLLAVAFFMAGLGATIQLQLIPWVTVIAFIPFLPSWIIDRLTGAAPAPIRLHPAATHWTDRWVPIYLLLAMLLLNAHSVSPVRVAARWTVRLASSLGLSQGWWMYAPDPGGGNSRLVVDLEMKDGSVERTAIGATRPGWPPLPQDADLERIWQDYRMRMHVQSGIGYSERRDLARALLRWYGSRHGDVAKITLRRVQRRSPTEEPGLEVRSVIGETVLLVEELSPGG